MSFPARWGPAAAVAVALLAGCAGRAEPGPAGSADPSVAPSRPAPTVEAGAPSTSPSGTGTPTATAGPVVGHPDELGEVPVLMYHQVLPHPRGIYDITPRAFRAELERLAREGYVPVTAADYAAGRLDLPAGAHPVVLTFDDSTRSQLTLDGGDRPEAGTAVAILLAVAAAHPGFTPTATFYVNRDPFADPGGARYLGWLREHGFDVGNHTLDHLALSGLTPARVRRQLAGDERLIRRTTGGPASTLALPFGIRPRSHRLMMSGRSGGTTYSFDAAFLVGAAPAPSPYSGDFDAAGVPRIRSQGRHGSDHRFGSSAWLDSLAAHPRRRYTSDGDPSVVTFPAARRGELGSTRGLRPRPY